MTKKQKRIAQQILMASDWDSIKGDIEEMTSEWVTIDFSSDSWENEVQDWCQKALGLSHDELFLFNLWKPFDGRYGFTRASEQMEFMRKYAPHIASHFSENDLVETYHKLEKLVWENLPY